MNIQKLINRFKASNRLSQVTLTLFLLFFSCNKEKDNQTSPTEEYPSLATIVISCANKNNQQSILLIDLLTKKVNGKKEINALFGRLIRFNTTSFSEISDVISSVSYDLERKTDNVLSFQSLTGLFEERLKSISSYSRTTLLTEVQIRSLMQSGSADIAFNNKYLPNSADRFESLFASIFGSPAYAQSNPNVESIVKKLVLGLFMLPTCSVLGPNINANWVEKVSVKGPCEVAKKLVKEATKELWDYIGDSINRALNPNDDYSASDLANDAQKSSSPSNTSNQTTSSSSSGGGYGDPHLRTMDGLYYDFQGHGEFIALKSLTDNFEIQVRQEQISPYLNRQVTMHTGIAINTGNDRVCVYTDRIYINNKQYGFGSTIVPLTKGIVSYSNGVVAVVTDNEDVIKITIQSTSPAFLDYKVVLNNNRTGKVQGLLGNFDGISSNDTQLQTGISVNPYTFSNLYPAFANSWRVSQDKSLFFYSNGTSTATYTKTDFPKSQTELDALARLQAETYCRQQGVTEEPFFSACVMDVVLAGANGYAVSAIGAEESKLLINNFDINKFTSFEESNLNTHGNAEIADGLMYLTPAKGNQSAAVYKKYKMDISNGFETSFDFSMTEPGGVKDGKNRVGADGIVFVIQDYGSKLIPPASGLGLGYDGLPRSIAIEFDTFDDLNYGIKESPDDIWLNTQGIGANSADDNKTQIKPQTRPLPIMNDGKIHNVVIRYTKKSEGVYKLEVFFDKDASPYLTADNINIQKTIGAYGTGVYMGLTASTGAGWENHIIHRWSYKPL